MDVKGYYQMITDRQLQHELLKTALEATDNYLTVEKKATVAGKANDDMIHDFSYYMSTAHDALQSLGILDQHQEYMKNHVNTMLKLLGHKDSTIGDLPYAHVPKPDIEDVSEHRKLSFKNYMAESSKYELSEDEIERMVESLTWEDIIDLYPESELIEDDSLDEALSAQARLKKRQAFARNRSRRNIAKGLKLRRSSSPEILKKRAVAAARRAMYKRLLRGRDKSTLSASEKSRIEQQVSKMKSIQQTIVNKMLPKIRSIEQSRLAHYRGKK